MRFEEELEFVKEKYLSPFCLNICDDVCCKNIQVERVPALFPKDYVQMKKMGFKEVNRTDKKINYFLDGYCNFYEKESRICKEHDNPFRPIFCERFPLTLDESRITFSSSCYISKNLEKLLDSDVVISFDNFAKKYNKMLKFYKKPL